jgi:hypothetical protein
MDNYLSFYGKKDLKYYDFVSMLHWIWNNYMCRYTKKNISHGLYDIVPHKVIHGTYTN